MKVINRAAVLVIPKQPYIDWANSLDDDVIKFGDNPSPEYTVYLVEDIPDHMADMIEIVKPHFETIFEEELEGWHLIESDWPQTRDFATFLEWFDVQIHSIVADLARGRIKTEIF